MCDSIIADTVELGKAARQREKESVMVRGGGCVDCRGERGLGPHTGW